MNQTINNLESQSGEKIETTIERYVEIADRRVAEFEQVLSRLIDRFESIGQTINRILARGKEQGAHLSELKDQAVDTLSPVANTMSPAVEKSRDLSRQLVSSARANPRPFLIGGGLVVGGLLLVAYYARKHDLAAGLSEGFSTAEQPESWRSESSAEFVQNGVANAS